VLERALRFVPVAVLVALIVPDLLQPPAVGATVPLNPRLPAGIVAAAVAWYTRNVTLTIVVGMATLLGLSLLF
jgi:branched-subunit amino acid transport protein